MANFPVSGSAVTVNYGWEVTYGTPVVTGLKPFGQGVKISTYDSDNTPEYVFGLGNQEAQKSVVKEFKGTWGVEFLLSDSWFFRAVLGGAPTTASSNPYTHTWTVANSGITNTLTPITIAMGFDLDTDAEHTLAGCIVNSCTLTSSVGEAIKCKLEGHYKTITKDATIFSPVAPVEDPFTFANATLQIPDSTSIADVQNFEISINRNTEQVWGLGSRFSQKYVAKQREYKLKMTVTYEDDTMLTSTWGAAGGPASSVAEIATAELTISNGLSTSATRSYVFMFGNCLFEKISIPSEVGEVVKQEITITARTLTSLVVSNNTAAAL